MQTRKEFLRNSAGLLGTLAIPSFFHTPILPYSHTGSHTGFPPPGIQLFTFFSVIDSDVEGTLKRIAEIGYVNIESAFSKKVGYYGLKPKEFASLLKGLGLKWKSHHVLGAPFKLPPRSKNATGYRWQATRNSTYAQSARQYAGAY